MTEKTEKFTILNLVENCDSFPDSVLDTQEYQKRTSDYFRFNVLSKTVGFIVPSVVKALRDGNLSGDWWSINENERIITLAGENVETRSKQIADTLKRWRDKETFQILKKWRNELYPVYTPHTKVAFYLERCGAALFGVVTYGSHLTAYVKPTESNPLRIWIARRNPTKTYGGLLDNAVAGGMGEDITPFDCIVKESGEEASLPAEFVSKNVKAVGFCSYFYERSATAGGEVGLLQPELEYCYDLEIPESTVLKPNDEEVQQFYLWTVEEVMSELRRGNFKPNCALVLIDFFIRHSFITAENEPDYIQIWTRIHRKFEFPTR